MSVPVYISEMAPSEHRGFLVSGNVAFITFGQVKQIPTEMSLKINWFLQKKNKKSLWLDSSAAPSPG